MRYNQYLIEDDFSKTEIKNVEKLKQRYSHLGDDVLNDIFSKLINTGKPLLIWALSNANEFQQLSDEEITSIKNWYVKENEISQGQFDLKNKTPKDLAEMTSKFSNLDLARWITKHWNDWTKNKTDFGGIIDWMNAEGANTDITKLTFKELKKKEEDWHTGLAKGAEGEGEELEGEDESGTVLMQMENGYYWIDLETKNCPLEAKMMGHCANTDQGDTLISLRKKGAKGRSWAVTLSMSDNNTVYHQGKGRANSLPKKEYQKYIVDFFIKFNTQKYEPEYLGANDFNITDFEDYNDYKRLKENNPEFVKSMISQATAGKKVKFFYQMKKLEGTSTEIHELLTSALEEKAASDHTISDDNALFVPTTNNSDFWKDGYDEGKVDTLLSEGVITEENNYYKINPELLEKYATYFSSALNSDSVDTKFLLRRIYYAYID